LDEFWAWGILEGLERQNAQPRKRVARPHNVDSPRERSPEGDLMIYVFYERALSRQWFYPWRSPCEFCYKIRTDREVMAVR